MVPDESESPARRFITPAEVADMLSLDQGAVESLLESGELRAIRIGPRHEWRIERSVLDGYLEAKYEESRRAALWAGSDFASVIDFDTPRRPSSFPPSASPPLSPTSSPPDDLT